MSAGRDFPAYTRFSQGALLSLLQPSHPGLEAGEGVSIDTSTANGRLIFSIFAALAEFERELIAERTRTGLAAARGREGHTIAPSPCW